MCDIVLTRTEIKSLNAILGTSLFIYFKIHLACINVYNQYFKNLLYCQSETTKRVVACFSRLLNLVNEQLSILEFIYNFNLHTIINYIHAQSNL